jgi:molybdenum cofactor biosynthesis enzyme MoaA
MSESSLKTELASQYDVVCFYDLADAVSQHGSVFKIFKKHYQATYHDRQRLIFYTSCDPSQLVLDHLQRAAARIDISNYFIIVCSPNDLTHKLQQSNNKYGTDDVAISWHKCLPVVSKEIDDRNIYPFESFCTLPFGFLTVENKNLLSPCCKYLGHVGHLQQDSLYQVFFNSQMQQLRQDIKNGQRHHNCKICWDTEDSGSISMRQHFINKYGHQCDQEWVDNPRIRDLTIMPTNLCNFKCRICNPDASSKIAVEELNFTTDGKQKERLKNLIKPTTVTDAIIVDQIFQIASDIQFLHILGGEPFMWSELEQLVKRLIDTGHAKHIQLEFNTNASVFPTDIIDQLQQFDAVEILISLDDINERFELQRGGAWPLVLQNIRAFKQLTSATFRIKFVVTVNIQNLLYLDQLVDFCSALDVEVIWCFLETPEYLSIDFVTDTVKQLVRGKYTNHPNLELQSIAQRMSKTAAVSGAAFLNHMQKLDQRRGQNSATVLKEIFDAMSC